MREGEGKEMCEDVWVGNEIRCETTRCCMVRALIAGGGGGTFFVVAARTIVSSTERG